MQMRPFGAFGQVSAVTLGGGGIGNVWGTVERAEAVATVRAALDAGITMLDVAPTYGPGEAELVVGEALDGSVPDGLLITTKVELPDDAPEALERKIAESLRASLERLRVEHVDLLLLHSQLQPDEGPSAPRLLSVGLFREVVRPAFERFKREGAIGGWGLTGVGHPRALIDVLSEDPMPDGIQCVANALDLTGDMWVFGPDERPDNPGDARVHRRAAAGLGHDVERAVERRHAVGEPAQTAALRRIRAADPVVGDPDVDHLALAGHHDACVGRVRVSDDVRERFGDDEVDGRLDRLRQPAGRQRRDLDRQREALGQRVERRSQPALRHAPPGGCREPARAARASRRRGRASPSRAARPPPRGHAPRASGLSAGRWRARRAAAVRHRAGCARSGGVTASPAMKVHESVVTISADRQ